MGMPVPSWSRRAVTLGGRLVLLGFVATGVCAGIVGTGSSVALGLLIAGAGLAAGAFGGFFVGLPHYSISSVLNTAPPPTPPTLKDAPQLPSNNMDQISDWLMKILLGAGLTQLGSIARWFRGLVDDTGHGLAGAGASAGAGDQARVLAAAILVLFPLFGFLFGYFLTISWFNNQTKPRPVVLALIPAAGPLAGGGNVEIVGTGFTGATAVTFGGAPATLPDEHTDTGITVAAPTAAEAGPVSVTVVTPAGTGTGGPSYTYT
jgi:uncharacterized protein YneF (UPF0154 family)